MGNGLPLVSLTVMCDSGNKVQLYLGDIHLEIVLSRESLIKKEEASKKSRISKVGSNDVDKPLIVFD